MAFPRRKVDAEARALDSSIRERLSIFANQHKSQIDHLSRTSGKEIVTLRSGKSQEIDDLLRKIGAALGLPERTKLEVWITNVKPHTLVELYEATTETPLAGIGLSQDQQRYSAASLKNPQYFVALNDLRKWGTSLISRSSRINGMLNYSGYQPFDDR